MILYTHLFIRVLTSQHDSSCVCPCLLRFETMVKDAVHTVKALRSLLRVSILDWSLCKCCYSHITTIRSLTSVYSLVMFQAWCPYKWCCTDITNKWFLSCVDFHVSFQIWYGCKCGCTYITNKRFFACMASLMTFQVGGLCKRCCTDITNIRFFACVDCLIVIVKSYYVYTYVQ